MSSDNLSPQEECPSPENPTDWSSSKAMRRLLENPALIPVDWIGGCANRLKNLRENLHSSYIGLDDVIDWLLAALIARENALLLGPPGVAKSELAVRIFKLLGLNEPEPADLTSSSIGMPEMGVNQVYSQWKEREEKGKMQPKYFHYLLSRYTMPEELFGPIEIDLLRQGMLARVNFGLLTGPGVYAGFLDEIFKASSSILNTLLTLTQERQYFNWGGMVKSDLLMLVGASNELPGGLNPSSSDMGVNREDFETLYAFLDRFPIRLMVPMASGKAAGDRDSLESDLAKAFRIAMERETQKFISGDPFKPRSNDMPVINDILLLGRVCVAEPEKLFSEDQLSKFRENFVKLAADLQSSNTDIPAGDITWTISPRKLKSLYKIALAHALVCNDKEFKEGTLPLGRTQLQVFSKIWDTSTVQNELQDEIKDYVTRNDSQFGG